MNCSAVFDGGNVVITCLRVEHSEQIVSIDYSINGGTTRRGEGLRVVKVMVSISQPLPPLPPQTVTSLSSIRIDQSDLVTGQNIITITVTGQSGVSRTYNLSLNAEQCESCLALYFKP